jgi:hypothetical protein
MSLKLRWTIALVVMALIMHWFQNRIDQTTRQTTNKAAALKKSIQSQVSVVVTDSKNPPREFPTDQTSEIFRLANLFRLSIDSTFFKPGSAGQMQLAVNGTYGSTRGFLVAVHNSIPSVNVALVSMRKSSGADASPTSDPDMLRTEIELTNSALSLARSQIDDSTKNPFIFEKTVLASPSNPSAKKLTTASARKPSPKANQPVGAVAQSAPVSDSVPQPTAAQPVPKNPPSLLGLVESGGKLSVIVLARGTVALKTKGDIADEQWRIKELNRESVTWSNSRETLELTSSLKMYWNKARP